nr:putative RNA-directed DNA polymerase, eukaryota [Tanacetum cinerariifolium]
MTLEAYNNHHNLGINIKIYGKNQRTKKRRISPNKMQFSQEQFWSSIERVISDMDVTWIVFCDFNVVRSLDERMGSSFDVKETNTFNDFISRSDHDIAKTEKWLMDLDHLDQIQRDDLKQKSRIKWAIEGDENTRRILRSLKLPLLTIFLPGLRNHDRADLAFQLAVLEKYRIKTLAFWNLAPMSVEEIKEAVWGCASSKAPGPDGFNVNFIKTFWNVIKVEFLECIRLVKVIDTVISPNQAAFISGRKILDGVLLVNEIIRMATIEESKIFLFEVDFEKAFDSVNWPFLLDTMRQMSFGSKWRSWISSCLSSASILVLVNGSPTKELKLERGLRQGDPLSPFLFLIVAEALQVSILAACDIGLYKGIFLANSGANLSLTQYADDALFFRKWSRENALSLIHILRANDDISVMLNVIGNLELSLSVTDRWEWAYDKSSKFNTKILCKYIQDVMFGANATNNPHNWNQRIPKKVKRKEDYVCRLQKSLYGLKQAPRQWVWRDKDVSYSHLRVFGCKASVHIPKDERSDVKNKPCVFLGYGQDKLGRSTRDHHPSTRYSTNEYVLLTDEGEPECYEEAMKDEHKKEWFEAMQDEMNSLHKNNTFEL